MERLVSLERQTLSSSVSLMIPLIYSTICMFYLNYNSSKNLYANLSIEFIIPLIVQIAYTFVVIISICSHCEARIEVVVAYST